jgi:hypothetical protein
MKNRTIVLASIGCLALAYLGVRMLRHGDPLASLEDSVLSSEYSSAFWAGERRGNTGLWARALERCSEAGNIKSRPNCAVVDVVSGKALENEAPNGVSQPSGATGSPSDEISKGLTGRGARQVPSGFRHRDAPLSAEPAAR